MNAQNNEITTLSGIAYKQIGERISVFQRVEPDIIPSETDVRIVGVNGNFRVDFGKNTGRLFPVIKNLEIVDGIPLYVARLPDDEKDFWSNEVVVYGTTEYHGVEFVDKLVTVVDGHPVFQGHTIDDGCYEKVVHGVKGTYAFHEVSHVYTHEGLPIYHGIIFLDNGNDDEECASCNYHAVVGSKKIGPFNSEPEIQVHGDQPYVYGVHNNQWEKILLNFEEIKKTPYGHCWD